MADLDFRLVALSTIAFAVTIYTIYRFFQVIRLWLKVRESQSWPSGSGMVVKSHVSVSRTYVKNLMQTSYSPVVSYEYTVNGKKHKGRSINFGWEPSYGNKRKADAHAARYPEGAVAAVFYNPSKPREAVLERQLGFGSQLGDFIIGVFVTIALWGMVIWFASSGN